MQIVKLLLCIWPFRSKKKWLWTILKKLKSKSRVESRAKAKLELYYLMKYLRPF